MHLTHRIRCLPIPLIAGLALVAALARTAGAQEKASGSPSGGSSSCPAGQVCTFSVTPGDSMAPTVTILPHGDSVHVASLAVEVDFADNVGLDRTRMSIYLNGTRVDGTFTVTGSGEIGRAHV